MTKCRGFIAGWGLLMLLGLVPVVMAEDPATPEDDPATADEPVTAPEPRDEEEGGGMPFALYLGFAAGTGSSDAVNTSIANDELNAGVSEFELTDQLYGRAVIGWKLPHQRGAFRFIFQGIKEEDYSFVSVGASTRLGTGLTADLDSGLVPWWFVSVNGGQLQSLRLKPAWDPADDAAFGDGDGLPDFGPCAELGGGMLRCGEITYDGANPDRSVSGSLADDMQNRINTYDVVYGREFGGRRFSSRWWGGLRYFEYEGQLLATTWLNTGQSVAGGVGGSPGEHFTDGSFLPLLIISQRTTGVGPVGSWEADFSFFDRALELYVRGEAAFTFNDLEMDSGPFFQIVDEGDSNGPAVLLEDRLSKSLEKSTWQDRGEIGARLYFKNGLEVEIAYSIAGYLDILMVPDLLQVGVTNEDPQTVTHDIVVASWHAGVGFQF